MLSSLKRGLTLFFVFNIISANSFSQQTAFAASSRTSRKSSSYGNKSSISTPLFSRPSLPNVRNFADFVGRDVNVASSMDFGVQAARVRRNQLTRIQADMRLQRPRSEQALNLGTSLAKLYEEQALYYENLRAMGLTDPSANNLDHAIKTTRSSLITVLDGLIEQFPRSPDRNHWKATTLISRIKINDPSVVRDVKSFAGAGRGQEGGRVLAVGIAADFVNRKNPRFGTVDYALRLQLDPISQAVFKIFKAGQSSHQVAKNLYEEAAKTGQSMRGGDGRIGPITVYAGSKLVDAALSVDSSNASEETISTLQSLGLQSLVYYYIERAALQNLTRQPKRSMAQYADIIELNELPTATSTKVEVRILDIALLSKDIGAIDSQWSRLSQIPGVISQSDMLSRILQTQQINWSAVESQASEDTVDRFVRQHDFFASRSDVYLRNEAWTIKVLDALQRVRKYNDVATRADSFFESSKTKSNKLIALRYSSSAREKILGLTSEPRFSEGHRLGGENEVATKYVLTLERMLAYVGSKESEKISFQIPLVTHLMGDYATARQKFESAIQKYPKGSYASNAVSFLLTISLRSGDHVYTEKIARLAESKRIKPSLKSHQNLRSLIEAAVYAQALELASQNNYNSAADKFVAFQKEFPRSKNADTALNLAAKNYVSAKQYESALTVMERLLSSYPKSRYAYDTRWQAAEQAQALKQYLRSANHFEAFAKQYKSQGLQRKAWLRGAEMQKAASRFASAIADLENYLSETRSQSEKVNTAKDIAEIQLKYGKTTQALSAYQRVIKISKNKDDEIWANSQIVQIYIRQGNQTIARSMIDNLLKMKPSSQEGFKTLAEAKFALGRMEAQDLRDTTIAGDKKTLDTLKSVISRFERTKNLYISPCEVPGADSCAVGYYEAARLAEDIALKLLDIELSPALNRNEFDWSKNFIAVQSEQLGNESRTLAEQAEQALASGQIDADMAERIRSYSQSHRGVTPE